MENCLSGRISTLGFEENLGCLKKRSLISFSKRLDFYGTNIILILPICLQYSMIGEFSTKVIIVRHSILQKTRFDSVTRFGGSWWDFVSFDIRFNEWTQENCKTAFLIDCFDLSDFSEKVNMLKKPLLFTVWKEKWLK